MLIIKNTFEVKTDLEQSKVVTSNNDSWRVFSDDVLFINLCSTAYVGLYGNIQSSDRSISWKRKAGLPTAEQ